jgi:hypothetical protein
MYVFLVSDKQHSFFFPELEFSYIPRFLQDAFLDSTSFVNGYQGCPFMAWTTPLASRKFTLLPEFLDNHYIKTAWLSALHTGRIFPRDDP